MYEGGSNNMDKYKELYDGLSDEMKEGEKYHSQAGCSGRRKTK